MKSAPQKTNWPETKGPKDAATSKGPNAKAMEAIASLGTYRKSVPADKVNAEGQDACDTAQSFGMWPCSANMPVESRQGLLAKDLPKAVFSDSAGRKWAYKGKRARVLVMLTSTSSGVTQWDTLPWHTRLGGTIHALREHGLVISTEIEGDDRHARYRLTTPGTIKIDANNQSDRGLLWEETQ